MYPYYNLHSTMYLFQPGIKFKLINFSIFTFHYVSISTAAESLSNLPE